MAISNESSGYKLCFIANISFSGPSLVLPSFTFYPITQGKTG